MNAFFYHKLVFTAWRIVAYNVFSGDSRGPDIFGTEPWHFYLRNLALNFNVWFMLALLAGPLVSVQLLLRARPLTKMSLLRSLMFQVPFYLWLAIFSLQPHKEERFMYPAYPFLCLNAAITLHSFLFYMEEINKQTSSNKNLSSLASLLATGLALVAILLSVLRTSGTITAYNAPLKIYEPLPSETFGVSEPENVCLGKDWYRSPSSYFLPPHMRLRFFKSAFSGLLPGQFEEASQGFNAYSTWQTPPGMNDQNIEDPGKYVSSC